MVRSRSVPFRNGSVSFDGSGHHFCDFQLGAAVLQTFCRAFRRTCHRICRPFDALFSFLIGRQVEEGLSDTLWIRGRDWVGRASSSRVCGPENLPRAYWSVGYHQVLDS